MAAESSFQQLLQTNLEYFTNLHLEQMIEWELRLINEAASSLLYSAYASFHRNPIKRLRHASARTHERTNMRAHSYHIYREIYDTMLKTFLMCKAFSSRACCQCSLFIFQTRNLCAGRIIDPIFKNIEKITI